MKSKKACGSRKWQLERVTNQHTHSFPSFHFRGPDTGLNLFNAHASMAIRTFRLDGLGLGSKCSQPIAEDRQIQFYKHISLTLSRQYSKHITFKKPRQDDSINTYHSRYLLLYTRSSTVHTTHKLVLCFYRLINFNQVIESVCVCMCGGYVCVCMFASLYCEGKGSHVTSHLAFWLSWHIQVFMKLLLYVFASKV